MRNRRRKFVNKLRDEKTNSSSDEYISCKNKPESRSKRIETRTKPELELNHKVTYDDDCQQQ